MLLPFIPKQVSNTDNKVAVTEKNNCEEDDRKSAEDDENYAK